MPEIAATELAERFERVRDHYEADGPDSTVPFASRGPARAALLTQYGDKGSYFLNYVESGRLEEMAAASVQDGDRVVAYFDLAELAGPEPAYAEGDVVMYEDERLYVVYITDNISEGMAYQELWLDPDENADFNAAKHPEVDEYRVQLVERAEPDQRLPARYDVAGVKSIVMFNTVRSRGENDA